MTVEEAERAFREMLPCELLGWDCFYREDRNLGRPIKIVYEKGGSLLTSVSLVFGDERCIVEYPIERLKLVEN
ncbi:MAG: hypothetical protein IJD91_01180 [Clostridia bacterium]|nr:hypothetical protein [Clostridia bacterium]